jgi:hypothetical protein
VFLCLGNQSKVLDELEFQHRADLLEDMEIIDQASLPIPT